ncbi:hypothetical protein CHARACLAT_001245 [Characodon lateralis]|uniref:Uncharacterized protein n=1 Tax=Characodon lateralis TaxID=208331 RepID=A0ABU7CJI2_9TELE|nr:hypothetical protein [Characodon lateralis]
MIGRIRNRKSDLREQANRQHPTDETRRLSSISILSCLTLMITVTALAKLVMMPICEIQFLRLFNKLIFLDKHKFSGHAA